MLLSRRPKVPIDSLQLFNRVRALWPDVIILKREAARNNGDPIWTIVGIYDEVEAQLSNEGDDWIRLAAWAFHQALFERAKKKLQAGEYTLRAAEVSFEEFDGQMKENLSDQSWAHIRNEYGC